MIRFGVVLSVVLIAIGLLVTGVVAGSLLLVVISIGVALLALLVLIGVVISFRHEIFGRTPIGVTAAGTSLAAPAGQGATQGRPVRPEPVTAAALTGLETASRPARVSLAEPAERATSDRPGPPPAEVRDRSRAKQEPGQPGAAPAGPVSPPDVRQKGAAARSKAQAAPLPQAPKPAEPAAPAAARTRADPDESGQREPAAAAERARPDSTTAGPAGSRSATAANREGADRGRLATQHGAGRLDRPSAEQPGDRDHAEPHRASRLERESVRAAGARSAAAETAIPAGAPAVAARDSAAASAGAAAKPAEPTASAAASGRTPGKPDPAEAPPLPTAEAPPLPTAEPARSDEQRDQEEAGSERTRQAEAAEAPAPVAAVASEPAIASTADDTPAGESAAGDDAMQVSVVPGITRYHRSDCQLIRFLSADDLDMMTKQAATENGCVPCKACKPDQLAADPAAG